MNSHPRIRCEHLIFAPVVSFIDSSHVGACKIFKNASSHFLLLSLSTLPLRTDLVRFGAGEGRAALPPDPPLPAEDALPGLAAAQVALPPARDINLLPKASAFPTPPQWLDGDFPVAARRYFTQGNSCRPGFAGFKPIFGAVSPRSSGFPEVNPRPGLLRRKTILRGTFSNFHPAHPQPLPAHLRPGLSGSLKTRAKILREKLRG